jgi:hypothetical protein
MDEDSVSRRRERLFHERPYQRHFSDKTSLTFREKKITVDDPFGQGESKAKNPCRYWWHGEECNLCAPDRTDPQVLELQIKALERKYYATRRDRYSSQTSFN